LSDIVYRFVSSGASEVRSAFQSIEAAASKSARAVKSSHDTGASSASKAASKQVAATEQAESKQLAIVEKAAIRKEQAQQRSAERAARTLERIRQKENDAILREVAAVEKAEERKRKAREKEDDRARKRRNDAIKGMASEAFFGSASAIGSAVSGLATEAIKESLELQSQANRLSITGRGAGKEAVDPSVIRRELEQAAIQAPGIKATDVGAGVEKYISLTGDVETARKSAASFATLASATNSKVEDIAATAASLGEKFDVKGIEEMRQAMATLTFQGKAGAFELKDMAGQFQRLSASAGAFDIGKGAQAVSTLGGLSQLARTGTGNARQATTAVENIFSHLTQNASKLKASGVDVFDKSGGSRNIVDVLTDTVSKVGGGDLAAKKAGLNKIFGKEGVRAINPLISTFGDAYSKAGGGKAGETAGAEAVKAKINEFIGDAGKWSEIEKDAALAQKDAGAQLTAAWELLKSKVAVEVVPAVAKLTPLIGPAAEAFAALVPVLGVFAEAVLVAVDGLKFLGLIKPKVESPHDAAKRTKKEYEEFDKSLSERIGPASAEELAKRDQLKKAAEDAQEALFPAADKGKRSNLNKLGVGITAEEWGKMFAERGGLKEGDEGFADAAFRGKLIHNSMGRNPTGDQTSMFNNDAQNQLIRDRQGEVQVQNQQAVASMNQLIAVIQEIAKNGPGAAKALAELSAMGKGRGSIVSGNSN
jgi:hypothetical protein